MKAPGAVGLGLLVDIPKPVLLYMDLNPVIPGISVVAFRRGNIREGKEKIKDTHTLKQKCLSGTWVRELIWTPISECYTMSSGLAGLM